MLSANLTLERIGQAASVPILWTRQIPDHKKGAAVNCPEDVYKAMKFLEASDREMLYALHLDTKNRIIAMELVTVGTLTNTLVHPREIFKGAILNNSARIILVHNHPSGDAEPTGDDWNVTERCMDAGSLLCIEILDHVIIGNGKYSSVKDSLEYIAEMRKREERKEYINRTVDILIETNERIKDRENLSRTEIKKLSRTLKKAVYKMFLTLGCEESYLERVYKQTARQLLYKKSV